MYQEHDTLMNMLKEHIQINKTFTHNNKVYNLHIEDLEMAYLSLTLNHNNDKIVIYLCLDNTNAIAINIAYMSKNLDANQHINDNVEDNDFLYEENVICPTNDNECITFIQKLFNTFLVDILNNKHIKSIYADDTQDKILF